MIRRWKRINTYHVKDIRIEEYCLSSSNTNQQENNNSTMSKIIRLFIVLSVVVVIGEVSKVIDKNYRSSEFCVEQVEKYPVLGVIGIEEAVGVNSHDLKVY